MGARRGGWLVVVDQSIKSVCSKSKQCIADMAAVRPQRLLLNVELQHVEMSSTMRPLVVCRDDLSIGIFQTYVGISMGIGGFLSAPPRLTEGTSTKEGLSCPFYATVDRRARAL